MPRAAFMGLGVLLTCLALAMAEDPASALAAPSPPGQPETGPGGSTYAYEHIKATPYGEAGGGYWILEPRERREEARPVVLFVHGLGATSYGGYEAWVTHLVRRGNVVVFPLYHGTGVVDPKTFTDTAAEAAAKAIAQCDGEQHALIDTDRLTMVGHSLGGTIVANLAARPGHYKLPAPKALMLLQSGDTRADQGLGALLPSITEDHATIAKGTLLLAVDVENDRIVSPKVGQRILDNAEKVDADDKRRLLLRSDDHGDPPIIADHMLPVGWLDRAGRHVRVNAYDYALWRWFDALQAVAHGEEQQRDLVFGEAAMDVGAWSDGTPVRPPIDAGKKE